MSKRKGAARTTADDHELAERTKKALQLRLAGTPYRDIARVVGVSHGTVHDDVQRALRDIPKREADDLRAIEVERLDALQKAVWDDALDGDLQAVDRAVRIIDRRAKMLGLDAPQQVEVSGQDVDLDATVAKILAAAQIVQGGQDGAGE